MKNNDKVKILNNWISNNNKIITISDKYGTNIINLTISKLFNIKNEERKNFLEYLTKKTKEYIKECNRINDIYRSELIYSIEKIIFKDIKENLSISWVLVKNNNKKILNKSIIILNIKYKKNKKNEEFKFLNSIKKEIEKKYNSWVGAGYNYELLIYKNIKEEEEI